MLNNFKQNCITKYVFTVLLAITVFLSACSTRTRVNEGRYGNTMCNVLSNGLAAEQDGWIYAILSDGIYKIKKDETYKEKITEDIALKINVWDDWIYYTNGYPGSGEIYRIKSDGTQREKINTERSYNVIIKDGWIYYSTIHFIDADDNCITETIEIKIKKMKLDGSNLIEIVSEAIDTDEDVNPCSYFYLYDDWIYYKSALDNNKFYKIKNDGSSRTKVSDENISNEHKNSKFIVDNTWIYYIHENKENKLYRMKTDGTENELVIDKAVADIHITENYIFYTDWETDKPYRRNKDGSSEIKLADYRVEDLNVIGDWIYCRDFDWTVVYYKIRIDGTSTNEEIEKGFN